MRAHVFIGVPVYREIEAPTKKLLATLPDVLRPRGIGCQVEIFRGCSLVEKARCELLNRFFAFASSSSTHLLHVDADCAFDPRAIVTMLEIDADLLVVPCRYRLPPHEWNVHTLQGELEDVPILHSRGHRVISVAHGGLAIALAKRETLEDLVGRHRELSYTEADGSLRSGLYHTAIESIEGVNRFLGEDVAFCRRVRAAGFQIYGAVDIASDHAGVRGRLGTMFERGMASA